MFVLMFIGLLVATETSVWAACLDGFVPWRGPDSDEFAINSKGACMPLCSNGRGLNLSNGVSFKLFADKTTTPSLNIMTDSMTCYADAISGPGAGLNMSDGKQTWHLYTPIPCSTKYTVSYSCGTGATGNAPDARIIDYGALLGLGYDYGTCYKKGYYPDGWYLDGVVKSPGTYVPYDYYADKTLTIRWSLLAFSAAYICNNGTTNSSYFTGYMGNSYKPSTTVCTAPDGMTFAGYAVQDAYGVDTGDVIAPGASFKWTYDNNIRLSAIWN